MGGDWDLVMRCAVWGVAFGVVGARAYHVLTSWSEVPDPKWKGVFEVWEGGLGVWGGIFLGVVAGAVIVWRDGARVRDMMDAVAPGLLLAQGIGRIGNWWNQELFGKPTDLPWALEIDPAHRPAGYFEYPTFHPIFLYELHLERARRARAALGRPALPHSTARPLRALRQLVHGLPLLRGGAADRPRVAPLPRHAAQLLGLARLLPRLDRLLRLVAVPAPRGGERRVRASGSCRRGRRWRSRKGRVRRRR